MAADAAQHNVLPCWQPHVPVDQDAGVYGLAATAGLFGSLGQWRNPALHTLDRGKLSMVQRAKGCSFCYPLHKVACCRQQQQQPAESKIPAKVLGWQERLLAHGRQDRPVLSTLLTSGMLSPVACTGNSCRDSTVPPGSCLSASAAHKNVARPDKRSYRQPRWPRVTTTGNSSLYFASSNESHRCWCGGMPAWAAGPGTQPQLWLRPLQWLTR